MCVAPFGVLDDGTVTSVLRTEFWIVVRCAGNPHRVQIPCTRSVIGSALLTLVTQYRYGVVVPTLEVVWLRHAVIAFGIASLVCSVLSLVGIARYTVFEITDSRWTWHTPMIARLSRSSLRGQVSPVDLNGQGTKLEVLRVLTSHFWPSTSQNFAGAVEGG